MAGRKTYAPEEKAEALAHLAATRGCVKEAARLAGVPRKTLEGWGKGKGVGPEVLRLMEETKKKLAAALMREAEEMAAELPGKRAGANYQQALVGIGIAVDKAQLLTGQPTQITDERAYVREVALRAFEKLYELALQRAAELGVTVTRADVALRYIQFRPELRETFCEQMPELRELLPPHPPLKVVGAEP